MKRPDEITIRTQTDLHETWTMLKGEWGFGTRQIWVMPIGADGHPLQLLQIEDLPADPDTGPSNLLRSLAETLRPDESVALMFARPGRQRRTQIDHSWANALVVAAREAGVAMRELHLANDVEVTVFAPDEHEAA